MFDPVSVKVPLLKRIEGYSRMNVAALPVTGIYTKQCPLKVNAQNPAVMDATLAGAEAMR
jgi:glutaminase